MLKKVTKSIIWSIKGGYQPKKFWDRWAHTFMMDPWQVKIHDQHAWLLEILKKEDPENILEVGCGFGRNIRYLKDQNISQPLTGVDISPEMIKKAKSFINNNSVVLTVADIHSLPFPDKSFDFVFTHGVLMHVPQKSIIRALSELVRVSSKTIVCIEQNYMPLGEGNSYTYIHHYRKMLKDLGINIVEYKKDQRLGLDLIYIKK